MRGQWLQVWITVFVMAYGGGLGAQAVAPAPAAVAPAPVLDRAAQAEFLRTAKVIRSRTLSTGVTTPYRLTLTDGTVTHDASFHSVNERAAQANFGARGVEFTSPTRITSTWRPFSLPACSASTA